MSLLKLTLAHVAKLDGFEKQFMQFLSIYLDSGFIIQTTKWFTGGLLVTVLLALIVLGFSSRGQH